jgi:hypothetical protein
VLILAQPHQEVIWFDVSVQKSFLMQTFESLDHVVADHEDCLEGELALSVVE